MNTLYYTSPTVTIEILIFGFYFFTSLLEKLACKVIRILKALSWAASGTGFLCMLLHMLVKAVLRVLCQRSTMVLFWKISHCSFQEKEVNWVPRS